MPPDSAVAVCGSCGTSIPDEPESANVELRSPCPNCGSLTRQVSAQVHAFVRAEMTGGGRVITYPQRLIATAEELFAREQYGISIVVSHMACEVATERALVSVLATKGLQYLEESIFDFLNGFNLGNPRNQKLYSALSGDAIQHKPFWAKFTASAGRRNKIIHRGAIASKEDARASLDAVKAFVAHLEQ